MLCSVRESIAGNELGGSDGNGTGGSGNAATRTSNGGCWAHFLAAMLFELVPTVTQPGAFSMVVCGSAAGCP
jgi:hypothetical protein